MIHAVIVDDEPMARKNLALILAQYFNADIKVVGEAGSVAEAYALIETVNPDLVFLDIEMGDETGFDLINKFESKEFDIVFVTAFDQYAIKGIKFCALDYLLKPVNIQELQQTLVKVKQNANRSRSENIKSLKHVLKNPGNVNNKIAIPTLTGYSMIPVSAILYLSAEKGYTYIIYQPNKKICSSTNIGNYEDLLHDYGFFRVHHSYIVNKEHIERYVKGEGGEIIMENGEVIPVSRRKKTEFIDWLTPL